jgi:hypothetical protein
LCVPLANKSELKVYQKLITRTYGLLFVFVYNHIINEYVNLYFARGQVSSCKHEVVVLQVTLHEHLVNDHGPRGRYILGGNQFFHSFSSKRIVDKLVA